MPRRARGKSDSGVYHVMLRGINRQDIFCDDDDRERFIETLIQVLRQMNRNERNKIIRELKDKGASIRQLARISGLGRRIVEKA